MPTNISRKQPTPDGVSFLVREPAEAYHAQSDVFLSSHALADFRKCPQLYHQKKLGLVRDEDRPAYLVGRAVHTLALEGRDRFTAEYAVGGPINEKIGQPFGAGTKAFAEWTAQHGKPVVTEAQFALVNAMAASVRGHQLATQLLSAGIPEGVVRTEYRGLACQIRMDWYNPQQGIVDLKTCDDLTWFEADARRFSYGHQMAFYRAVLAQVIGAEMPVFFIAVEKREPFRCGVWVVTNDTLASARRENEAAIERLKACLATGEWPTGYEECRYFDGV